MNEQLANTVERISRAYRTEEGERTVTIDRKSFQIPIGCTGGQLLATAIAQNIIRNGRYQLQGRNCNGTNTIIGESDVIPDYYKTFDVELEPWKDNA